MQGYNLGRNKIQREELKKSLEKNQHLVERVDRIFLQNYPGGRFHWDGVTVDIIGYSHYITVRGVAWGKCWESKAFVFPCAHWPENPSDHQIELHGIAAPYLLLEGSSNVLVHIADDACYRCELCGSERKSEA